MAQFHVYSTEIINICNKIKSHSKHYINKWTKVQNPRYHYNVHAHFPQKMADYTYGLQRREYWISAMERFQRILQLFWPLSPTKYVTVFSG